MSDLPETKARPINNEVAVQSDTIDRLLNIVGDKRRVLCLGNTTVDLAFTLEEQLDCEVTLLIDPSEHTALTSSEKIKLVIEKIELSNITKRFSANDFDVIFISDTFHQIEDYGALLSGLIAHFSTALIISAPQLQDDKKSIIASQAKEIQRLNALLDAKEKNIAWYTKHLREHLLNHYKLEKTARERIEEDEKVTQKMHSLSETIRLKEHSYHLLEEDRNRILNELNRVRKYSPDVLPAVLKYPLKSMISVYSNGILSPFKSLKKKVATRKQSTAPGQPL